VSAHLDVSLLVFGALVMLGALASGIARRTVLSLTAVFVVAGFVLGRGGVGALHFHARSPFVADLAIVALIVILFHDGLEVDAELLQTHWHLPLRKLVLAMPLTFAIVAAAAKLFTNLSWLECLLLGALLAPTDPVLSSNVITNPRVPGVIRHSLNLESGLNDGLALPAVLAFAAALTPGGGHFVWWRFVLQDLAIGFATGIVVGFLAARLMPRDSDLEREIPAHQKSLFLLGTAFACYGIAVTPPHGNGLIAVFVGGITLGVARPDLRAHFENQSVDLVEIVKLGVFVVFGSVLTLHGLFKDGWAAVGIVVITLLVARPVAVFASLIGTKTDVPMRAFMGWFGPKGVATITFALFVLSDISAGNRIFELAALVVFVSVIAHGLTDTPGAEWIARRVEKASAAGDPTPAAPSGQGSSRGAVGG
jgi:NhaP-type Na+/H+ or K+/H+ antiporter